MENYWWGLLARSTHPTATLSVRFTHLFFALPGVEIDQFAEADVDVGLVAGGRIAAGVGEPHFQRLGRKDRVVQVRSSPPAA